MKNMFKKLRKGFNLVEIIISLVLVGIVAAAVVYNVTGAPAQARLDTKAANAKNLTLLVQNFVNSGGTIALGTTEGVSGSTLSVKTAGNTDASAVVALLNTGLQYKNYTFKNSPSVATPASYSYTIVDGLPAFASDGSTSTEP